MRLAVIAALLTACSLNQAAIVTSTTLMVCDWGQTHSAAKNGWRGIYETNPILGKEPTTKQVDAYFATAIAINWLLFYLTPPRWRALGQAGVIGIETWAVADNWVIDSMGTCGY